MWLPSMPARTHSIKRARIVAQIYFVRLLKMAKGFLDEGLAKITSADIAAALAAGGVGSGSVGVFAVGSMLFARPPLHGAIWMFQEMECKETDDDNGLDVVFQGIVLHTIFGADPIVLSMEDSAAWIAWYHSTGGKLPSEIAAGLS
jgi:hypothetical protein